MKKFVFFPLWQQQQYHRPTNLLAKWFTPNRCYRPLKITLISVWWIRLSCFSSAYKSIFEEKLKTNNPSSYALSFKIERDTTVYVCQFIDNHRPRLSLNASRAVCVYLWVNFYCVQGLMWRIPIPTKWLGECLCVCPRTLKCAILRKTKNHKLNKNNRI